MVLEIIPKIQRKLFTNTEEMSYIKSNRIIMAPEKYIAMILITVTTTECLI